MEDFFSTRAGGPGPIFPGVADASNFRDLLCSAPDLVRLARSRCFDSRDLQLRGRTGPCTGNKALIGVIRSSGSGALRHCSRKVFVGLIVLSFS